MNEILDKIDKALEALDQLQKTAAKNNLSLEEIQNINVAIYYTERVCKKRAIAA